MLSKDTVYFSGILSEMSFSTMQNSLPIVQSEHSKTTLFSAFQKQLICKNKSQPFQMKLLLKTISVTVVRVTLPPSSWFGLAGLLTCPPWVSTVLLKEVGQGP